LLNPGSDQDFEYRPRSRSTKKGFIFAKSIETQPLIKMFNFYFLVHQFIFVKMREKMSWKNFLLLFWEKYTLGSGSVFILNAGSRSRSVSILKAGSGSVKNEYGSKTLLKSTHCWVLLPSILNPDLGGSIIIAFLNFDRDP